MAVTCGVAPSATVPIAARLIEAIGAPMLYLQVLAGLRNDYQGDAQARAFGLFGATIGVVPIAGQLLGGALIALSTAGLGWRAVFLVNVPIGRLLIAGVPTTWQYLRVFG